MGCYLLTESKIIDIIKSMETQYIDVAGLFRLAKEADDRFHAALVGQYGKRAGDMRYHTKKQPPHIQTLGREFQEATDTWRKAVEEARA